MSKEMQEKKNKITNKGITLIALVITIIVLLILAGISIATLTGDNGLLEKAITAKSETEKANLIELVQLDIIEAQGNKKSGNLNNEELSEIFEKYFEPVPNEFKNDTILVAKEEYGKYEIPLSDLYDGNIEESTTITIPEGLEIGTAVSYTPSGTYDWDSRYYTNDTTGKDTITLDSSSEDFKITDWRVLDIDEKSGEITLVPTTPTNESVKLDGAQGYNNGVYLLNTACSKLYGNEEKDISAKSIDMSILEKYMTTEAINEAHSYEDYGSQKSEPYTGRNIFYPAIYAQEANSVIDDIKKESGLSMNTQTEPIAIDDTTAPDGFLSASTSINPYQTYYYASSNFTETAFKDVPNSELNYYELLMPKDTDTYYWVASRCIQHHTSSCEFGINYIEKSRINMIDLSYSDEETQYYSCKLFPIVTLNVNLISGNSSSGFSVNV